MSAFFQSSPSGRVKVELFSPVKKGAMMTGDAVLRIGKGLGACLDLNVRAPPPPPSSPLPPPNSSSNPSPLYRDCSVCVM